MAVVTHINPLLLATKKGENTTLLNFGVSTPFCFFFFICRIFLHNHHRVFLLLLGPVLFGFVSQVPGHVVKQRLICPLLLCIPESRRLRSATFHFNSQTNHGIVEMGWEHALCQHGSL